MAALAAFLWWQGAHQPNNLTSCVIKGNISLSGERIYHLPRDRYYDATVIKERFGERWFCSESDPVAAGWRRPRFAGAVLGFIVTKIDAAGIAPETIVGASLLGLLLCGYCLILIAESKKHIIKNWARAERCKNQINNLGSILPGKEPIEGPMAYVWNQVLCVVGVFAILFVAALVWALEG